MYRVLVGEYETEEQAGATASLIRGTGSSGLIVRIDSAPLRTFASSSHYCLESMAALTMDPPRVLVGRSPKVQGVLQQMDKVSSSRWPVLILGETGTGKELIAKNLHSRSAPGPFVVVDCSSLVGPLMESELFGHTKGAFTGAAGPKLGLIEMANGGTAFFDEIGELPLDLQAKLLRVLQEKEFRPVGSTLIRRSDFRVISATNRDLAAEVEKGTFRRDLYFRLNVITLRLPPLRSRMEDIPDLVDHFLRRYGRGHQMSAEAMKALLVLPMARQRAAIGALHPAHGGCELRADSTCVRLTDDADEPHESADAGYAGGRIRSRI